MTQGLCGSLHKRYEAGERNEIVHTFLSNSCMVYTLIVTHLKQDESRLCELRDHDTREHDVAF